MNILWSEIQISESLWDKKIRPSYYQTDSPIRVKYASKELMNWIGDLTFDKGISDISLYLLNQQKAVAPFAFIALE